MSAPVLGGGGICSVDMPKLAAGTLNDRGYGAQGGAPLASLPGGPQFASRYEKPFGARDDVYSPAFYAATMVVAQAIKAAGSTDPRKLVPALRRTQFSTLVGKVAFDASGEWIDAPVTVYKVSADALSPVKSAPCRRLARAAAARCDASRDADIIVAPFNEDIA